MKKILWDADAAIWISWPRRNGEGAALLIDCRSGFDPGKDGVRRCVRSCNLRGSGVYVGDSTRERRQCEEAAAILGVPDLRTLNTHARSGTRDSIPWSTVGTHVSRRSNARWRHAEESRLVPKAWEPRRDSHRLRATTLNTVEHTDRLANSCQRRSAIAEAIGSGGGFGGAVVV